MNGGLFYWREGWAATEILKNNFWTKEMNVHLNFI